MFVFTHLALASYFYQQIKEQKNKELQVNKLAFLYGSIKPDLSSMAGINHYVDESYNHYSHYLSVANKQDGSKESSEALGVVCHFLCDYFCKYHALKPYKEASIVEHLIYELKLHIHVISQLFTRRLFRNNHQPNLHDYQNRHRETMDYLESETIEDEKLLELLEAYKGKRPSLNLDFAYAMLANDQILSDLLGVSNLLASQRRQASRPEPVSCIDVAEEIIQNNVLA